MAINPISMITFEEALRIVLNQNISTETESVALTSALNRVLAEDAFSDMDMPPFHKSAMDGYACRKMDLNNELTIIDEIPAGTIPNKSIGENQCSRIMTGAMVPEGADFVIMKEHTHGTMPGKIKHTRESNNENICYRGEDVRMDDIIVDKGAYLLPQHIASLASVGITMPLVYKKPSVAVLSTGNELVEPDTKPGISQIRNSNGYQMLSQAMQIGLNPDYLGIVPDNETLLFDTLKETLEKYDVILISGGVSVGDYDFVPKVLLQLGVETIFHGLKAKPGKHLLFGRKDNHFIFGMPGNPVSSFIQFEILVYPFLNKLMGNTSQPVMLQIPLAENYFRKKSDVLAFVPITITQNGAALPLDYHGSAHISSYTRANGILEIPLGINELNKGEIVSVRPL